MNFPGKKHSDGYKPYIELVVTGTGDLGDKSGLTTHIQSEAVPETRSAPGIHTSVMLESSSQSLDKLRPADRHS